MAVADRETGIGYGTTTLSVIMAVSICHGINDIMQSLLSSLYPLFKTNYNLDFVQIGLLTLAFQVTASLLQPIVGLVTDRWPMPYSLPVGMASTFFGLILLGNAHSFGFLVMGACMIGFGSSVFHPESSRVARLASGGRHGLAQSVFQVGGNAGSAIGPLAAAFIVLPHGQRSVAWFALAAMIVGRWTPLGAFGAALLFASATGISQSVRIAPPPGQLGDVLHSLPPQFFDALPYLVTIVVLAGVVGRSIPPAADGQPYEREAAH